MNLKQAAQLALEYTEQNAIISGIPIRDVLRAALAEDAMQRLTDVQQEIEKTHISVDNEYTPVKSWAWNEYPIDTDTTRGPMLMTVGDTLSRAGFIKKQEPLTDEEITRLWVETEPGAAAFARAIERAHGIGDKNG